MNSYYEEILEKIKLVNDFTKRKLIKDISELLLHKPSENEPLDIVCPYCKGKYIVKNGKNKNKQRYLCKNCKKSFVTETNTPIYCSKKDLSTWILFLESLINQDSLRKISKDLNISLSTAFFWRHKILDAIRENHNENILRGKIQSMKLFLMNPLKVIIQRMDLLYLENHIKEVNPAIVEEYQKKKYAYLLLLITISL